MANTDVQVNAPASLQTGPPVTSPTNTFYLVRIATDIKTMPGFGSGSGLPPLTEGQGYPNGIQT